MLLRSPKDLHYPITVTELLKRPADAVERFAPLFSYFYTSTVTEGNRYGDEWQVERNFPTRYESETDGTLREWKIAAGSVIVRAGLPLVEIEEPCRHEIQFGGMCANCGKDMTEVAYNTSTLDSARAPINMIHGNTALTVSQAEATRAEEEAKKRLLAGKKLSLVVDLDQTIIHATVDPTVGEWQSDPDNPNHDAVKDVRAFQLLDDGPGARGCWYYIKLRPGLQCFLENISELYELHIYTMGTRAYAQNIAKIVDPTQRIFGDRILSRDESGSMVAKSLRRLFPVDTKMVVIIDDRGDVWSWSENLIKVPVYDFFVGIGDINSSFLPKLPEQSATGPPDSPKPAQDSKPAASVNDGRPELAIVTADKKPNTSLADGAQGTKVNGEVVSVLEKQLVSMGGGDDKAVREEQSHKQEEEIAAQVSDRPLAQKQQQLDKVDEKAAAAATAAELDHSFDESQADKPRHNLLQDSDVALDGLEASLGRIHQAFYDIYDQRLAEKRKTSQSEHKTIVDLSLVPDVKEIISAMKRGVLAGKELVFSGVIPLGLNIHLADIVMWSKDFGATISEQISKRTTHVIAARNRRTAKVRQAIRYPKIKIVGIDWLHECFVQWKQVDETPYAIHTEPDHQQMSPQDLADGSLLEDVEDVNLSSEDDVESPIPFGSNDNSTNNNKIAEDLEALEPKSPMVERSMIGGTDQDWRNMHDEMEEWLAESGVSADSDDDDDSNDNSSDNVDNMNEKHDKIDDDNSSSSSISNGEDGESSSSRSHARKRKRKHLLHGTASADTTDAEESDASVSMSAVGHAKSNNDKNNYNNNHDSNNKSNSSSSNDLSKLQKRKRRALQRVSSLNNVTSAENQMLSSSNLARRVGPSGPVLGAESVGVLDNNLNNDNHHHLVADSDNKGSVTGAAVGDEASALDADAKGKMDTLGRKMDKEKEKEKEKDEEEDADLEAEMEAELSKEDL